MTVWHRDRKTIVLQVRSNPFRQSATDLARSEDFNRQAGRGIEMIIIVCRASNKLLSSNEFVCGCYFDSHSLEASSRLRPITAAVGSGLG